MLSIILFLPLAVALVGFLVPRGAVGWWSTLGSLGSLALAVALVADFNTSQATLQHVVDEPWIPGLGVRYTLGVDGISIFMVLLTSLLWAASNLYSALQGPDRERTYFFMLGLAQTATLGAFLAQDLLLFVLFFDLMLVPFYFLVGGWGTGERIPATIKMIVYTLIGSLLMLVGAIATAVLSGDALGGTTFNISELSSVPLGEGTQSWIFWMFAAAFLVKMPAFLVHGWMADAYRACPLPVLVLLSGVLSKVGAYGFLRVVLPIFPEATINFQDVILILSVVSILYGSVMAFTQTNTRLIAGYSSIAQLGFITLGIFSLRPDGADGAVLQMFNHGLVVAPVFFIIALLYDRFESEDIRDMGGFAKHAPTLAILFVIVTMALLAIPGSANFVGEFYILAGLFETKVALALIASVGIALAAFYALRMYQQTMHNREPDRDGIKRVGMTRREGVVLVPLVGCILAIALYPGLILERGEASVSRSVLSVAAADCTREADANPATNAVQTFLDPACVKRYGLENLEQEQGAEETGSSEPAREAGEAKQ